MNEELDTRKGIYDIIRKKPGIHFQGIKKQLDMATGTLEHHLNHLVERGVITSKKDRYYKRYFPRDIDRKDKIILSSARQKNPRRISVYLLLHPRATHGEIMEELGIKPSTLSFYLKELLSKGIVQKKKQGRESLYWLTDEERVEKVFLIYRKSLLDDIVDTFVETWLDGFL
ncbi:MAG: winged helix-turn-helix transcriptional regulator [Thermoplasmata archaeon]